LKNGGEKDSARGTITAPTSSYGGTSTRMGYFVRGLVGDASRSRRGELYSATRQEPWQVARQQSLALGEMGVRGIDLQLGCGRRGFFFDKTYLY